MKYILIGKFVGLSLTIVLPACKKTEKCPSAVTELSSSITQSSATLNGTVHVYGNSELYFEYGTSPTYGQSIFASPHFTYSSVTSTVTATLTGLSSSTTYHYRVKVASSCGNTYGRDFSFTTLKGI